MLVAPSLAHQVKVGLHVESLPRTSLVVAERIPAVEDQFRHALRVADGVRDGDGGTLRKTEKRVRTQP
jgi:hypothetical protein